MKKPTHGESHTEKLLNNESLPQLLEPNGIFVLEKTPDRNSSSNEALARYSPENLRRNRSAVSEHRIRQSQSQLNDSFHLQSALAARALVLFAGLFRRR